jgi:hypothetical protein
MVKYQLKVFRFQLHQQLQALRFLALFNFFLNWFKMTSLIALQVYYITGIAKMYMASGTWINVYYFVYSKSNASNWGINILKLIFKYSVLVLLSLRKLLALFFYKIRVIELFALFAF